MAALGKILRKGTGNGHSAYDTVRYEPLNQDPADNEQEDDDVVFVQDGRPNGVSTNGKPTDIQELRNSMHEDIEVGDLGLQKAKVSRKKPANDVEVKVMKQGTLTRTRILCFVLSLLALVLCIIAFTGIMPYMTKKKIPIIRYNQTDNWQVKLDNTGSESCVRLWDVDGDGRDDILLGTTTDYLLDDPKLHREQMKAICRRNNESFPCAGKIVALRGYDGAILWRMSTYMEVFEINCGNIDIDKDGKMDCIGTGRMSTVAAFDPRKGVMLWEGDPSVLKDTWNTYNVVILPDLTGDGVAEVLLPHGGDPSFSKMEKSRYPGRLLLLDGATGKSVGRYLEMPDGRELYMSPVLHTKKDGAQYILFGHGGESVSGSFLAISVPDFYRYVKETESNAAVPNTRGNYDDWEQKLTRHPDTGILEIFKGPKKGVMVPPLLLEMTGDDTKDILMSAYDSIFILYNGETLEQIWKAEFPDFETYSTPAPAFFNDDKTLDFMLHLSKGEWPTYDFSLAIILDGTSGKVLWSFNSSFYEMTSDIVVRTAEPYRDAYVFRVRGRGDARTSGLTHGVIKQDGDRPVEDEDAAKSRNRRHGPFSRKTYKRPPSPPPLPSQQRPQYQPPAPPPPRRNSGQYSSYPDRRYSPQPQYTSGQYRQQVSPPQYAYYDDGSEERGRVVDGDTDDSRGYYENQFAPEYENNGGLIVGGEDTGEEPEMEGGDRDDEDEMTIVFPEYISECSYKSPHTTEFFIMDRSTIMAPILVRAVKDYFLNYTLSNGDRIKADNILTENLKGRKRAITRLGPMPKKKTPLCTLMEIQEVNTAAVGDVDGDGIPDLVAVFHAEGNIVDERRVFLHSHFETHIHKINLDGVLSNGEAINIKPIVSAKLKNNKEKEKDGLSLRQMKFRPMEEQKWTQYLGPHTDSILH